MSKWVLKCEEVLEQFKNKNGIPYDFESFDSDIKQLPDAFIVYFLVSDNGKTWYDGKENNKSIRLQVSFFYREKADILTIPAKIESAFKDAGFLRVGAGRIPYQENTGHYGWRCDFRYFEK